MADKTMRERNHEAAKRSLDQALQALKTAQLAVGAWADSVSAEVEQRDGLDLDDPRRYDDPEYAAALDIVGKVHQAQQDMQQVMQFIDWRSNA
jgi:hypothetical protein